MTTQLIGKSGYISRILYSITFHLFFEGISSGIFWKFDFKFLDIGINKWLHISSGWNDCLYDNQWINKPRISCSRRFFHLGKYFHPDNTDIQRLVDICLIVVIKSKRKFVEYCRKRRLSGAPRQNKYYRYYQENVTFHKMDTM